ncbi:hypothetical protein W97_00813 [Coniosporium apollinis CBS 100218]|uniref:Protein MAK16 n=1 Tax=Coniosporium apollinis (strain CBS 100218) TaxID=1168221 RepID=R7YI99_CONA1|nr:uncharacterized protein W97_00813 [Coniosporium apollinis CBS 100218]EON61598.1 hypothetical protein W97_00813 [Coniosporium apollinis CBS 100218]
MASDEIVWQVINNQFCSFKLKTTKESNFCRNEYNVTGLCRSQYCPLANSRYATVRQGPNGIFLYIKAVERAHMPNKWWEKIKLPSNYAKALEEIDTRLIFFPKVLVHRCKQRLTRLTQVAIRTKRLMKENERLGEKLVPKLAPKVRRREETRMRKAEAAAKIERAIERELLQRMKEGAYGEQPLNVDEKVWQRFLKRQEKSGEALRDEDLDEGIEEEEETEHEYEYERGEAAGDVEYVSDVEGESDEDRDDLEDWIGDKSSDQGDGSSEEEDDSEDSSEDEDTDDEELKKALGSLKRKRPASRPAKPVKKGRKGPHVEIEYEREPAVRQAITS